MSDREDSQNPSVPSYGSGGRSPTLGFSSSSSSSNSEHPATSPQKKPADASTCAPSSPVAQVVSVAQPGDEGYILLDDRLVQTQSSVMQKAQVHEVRNLMPDGYQLTYRATWKSIIPLHVGTAIGIHYHSIKDLGEFSIHPFKVLFLESYGIMPGQLAPNGHRLLGSFINVCRFLRIPLSLRLFDHMFDVRPGSKETLRFVEVSSHQGRTFLCGLPPSNKKWKDKYVSIKFPPGRFPFCPECLGEENEAPVVKFQSKFAVPQIVVEEPSTAQLIIPPSSQPFSLEEQPTQSHQGTNQPIHSGENYFNVDTFEFDNLMGETRHTSQAGVGGQPNEGGVPEEEAVGESLQRKRRKTEEAARAKADKIEAKWTEHCVVYRQLYAKHDGLLKAAKEADEQAQAKIQQLEAENARSAEEIARLGDELQREQSERAAIAAAWAAQAPEEFAAKALPDRETAIRFFQGLYKHPVSAGIVDEIGTYGFESGQYSERKALYGILE
ncbi:unnamed protein product [Cuscuta campestris]|uniref:Transposase (putative) gypsy type domain-containing protein n=1 Tax=Cuscuta campestris TaxID=132261 RepID=A0A484MXH2_9ASTE|nr:unnamed protein product [Cuscuta campestris]